MRRLMLGLFLFIVGIALDTSTTAFGLYVTDLVEKNPLGVPFVLIANLVVMAYLTFLIIISRKLKEYKFVNRLLIGVGCIKIGVALYNAALITLKLME